MFTVDLLGQPRTLPFEELEPQPSPHTGRLLRRRRIGFTAPAGDSDKLVDVFAKARELDGALTDAEGRRWIVTDSQYSYQDGDRLHGHSANLQEAEDLHAERIEMLGLSLVPTRYEESFERDENLVITARVEADAATDKRLEQEITTEREDYFDVTRVGLSNEVLRMRFGKCLWQRTGKGRIHRLVLVSEKGDERNTFFGLFEPERSRMMEKASVAEEALKVLLVELEEAGALSAAAVKRVHASAEDAFAKHRRDFEEASNLDLYDF